MQDALFGAMPYRGSVEFLKDWEKVCESPGLLFEPAAARNPGR
jgi:hypothetical protein